MEFMTIVNEKGVARLDKINADGTLVEACVCAIHTHWPLQRQLEALEIMWLQKFKKTDRGFIAI